MSQWKAHGDRYHLPWWATHGDRKSRQLVTLWSLCIHGQEAWCRHCCAAKVLTYTLSQDLGCEIAPPEFRVTLPPSVKSFWKHLDEGFHGDSKSCQVEKSRFAIGHPTWFYLCFLSLYPVTLHNLVVVESSHSSAQPVFVECLLCTQLGPE